MQDFMLEAQKPDYLVGVKAGRTPEVIEMRQVGRGWRGAASRGRRGETTDYGRREVRLRHPHPGPLPHWRAREKAGRRGKSGKREGKGRTLAR